MRIQIMTNRYIVEDNDAYLEITRKDGSKYYYLIDICNIDKLKRASWAVAIRHTGVYAYSMKEGLLHRYVLDLKKGQVVDHLDRCTFNNKVENLEITNYSCNGFNKRQVGSTSGYRYIEPIREQRRKQKWAVNVCKRFRKRYYKLKTAIKERNNYILNFEPLLWRYHQNELINDFREFIDDEELEEEQEEEEPDKEENE